MAVSSVIRRKGEPQDTGVRPGGFCEGQLSGQGRGAGANSGLPGCGHQATRGRSRRELHGSSRHSEYWGGANFSLLFAPNRVGGSVATRESPPRSALLPAGALWTGGAHQGAGPLLNLEGTGGSRTAPIGGGQRSGIRRPQGTPLRRGRRWVPAFARTTEGTGGSRTAPTGDGQRNGIRASTRDAPTEGRRWVPAFARTTEGRVVLEPPL